MQVGSFFECYALLMHDGSYWGSHIQEFANINDMVISKKNVCVGDLNVVMAGFGINQLEKYVKKMQNAGYTIPVFVHYIKAKNTTIGIVIIDMSVEVTITLATLSTTFLSEYIEPTK